MLAGVVVEVNDATGGGDVSVTDATGQYSFSRLAPGTHELTPFVAGLQRTRAVEEVVAGNIADLISG